MHSWRERLTFIADGAMYYVSEKRRNPKELVCRLADVRHVEVGNGWPPGHYTFKLYLDDHDEVAKGDAPVSLDELQSRVFSAASPEECRAWVAVLSGGAEVQAIEDTGLAGSSPCVSPQGRRAAPTATISCCFTDPLPEAQTSAAEESLDPPPQLHSPDQRRKAKVSATSPMLPTGGTLPIAESLGTDDGDENLETSPTGGSRVPLSGMEAKEPGEDLFTEERDTRAPPSPSETVIAPVSAPAFTSAPVPSFTSTSAPAPAPAYAPTFSPARDTGSDGEVDGGGSGGLESPARVRLALVAHDDSDWPSPSHHPLTPVPHCPAPQACLYMF